MAGNIVGPAIEGKGFGGWHRLEYQAVMRRTLILALSLSAGLILPASAGWFDQAGHYLVECEKEAMFRFKMHSGHAVRRHIHLCMITHGYVFHQACGEAGWTDEACYRTRWKWEGR